MAKGQKPARSTEYMAHTGPPDAWELDDQGRPLWVARIPDVLHAPWWSVEIPTTVKSRPRLDHAPKVAMPIYLPGPLRDFAEALVGTSPPGAKRSGHPGLTRTEPEAAAYAAWLADMRFLDAREIALVLNFVPPATKPRAIARPARKRAERFVAAGRLLLRQQGVVPWFLWEDGAVPPDWAVTRGFWLAITHWYRFYVVLYRRELRLVEQLHQAAAERQRLFQEDPHGAWQAMLRGEIEDLLDDRS